MGVIDKISSATGIPLPLTYAIPAALLYESFYLLIAPLSLGVPMALLVAAEFLAASYYRSTSFSATSPYGMTVPIAVHVVAWILQFYGHGVHERRSPALMDNLFQAIFMAPFFVFIEVLFKFGLLKDLKAAVEPSIAENIRVFKAKKGECFSRVTIKGDSWFCAPTLRVLPLLLSPLPSLQRRLRSPTALGLATPPRLLKPLRRQKQQL